MENKDTRCNQNSIADENNNFSISDCSTLIEKNANDVRSTEPTGVAKDRNGGLGLLNGEKSVQHKINPKLGSNSQVNTDSTNIRNELVKDSFNAENGNLIKQQAGPFTPQGKAIVDPQYNKSRVALHSALRAKEAQVCKAQVNRNGQSRNQGYVLSEVEIHCQLWKMFIAKMGVSEYQFPLSEQSDHTTSFSASVFPSLPLYCSDEMWCTARGGNLNATATLHKVRIIVKQAFPKAKSLPSSCAKPLQQAPSAGGNLPRSDLAISAKTKAELKAQSDLKDYSLLNLFPLSNTSVKAFHQLTPTLQEASPSELLAAVQEFLPTLDFTEVPSGRQVPTDPQSKRQTGQGSHQGEQSKGAMSGSVQSGGISSGVGGQGGASGSDGGDGDPPWKHTKSHYDDEPKPKKKKKKKKAVVDEKDSADSVTSDDEPKPKPHPKPQSMYGPYNEGETDDEQPRQNDSGTHPESPAPTPHSAFAEEECKTQPHFPGPCLIDYTAKMSYCLDSQNVEASLVSPEHEETQKLPIPFSLSMSLPRLSPQSLSPTMSPSPVFEGMFPSPPSSHDSAVSSQSEAGSTSYSSLSDTSAGIEETQNPTSNSELPIFPPLSSLPAAELNTTANFSPPPTTMEQSNYPIPFNSQVSQSATSESATDDDSDALNYEKGDRANC